MKILTIQECQYVSGAGIHTEGYNVNSGDAYAKLGTELYNEYHDHRWSKTFSHIFNSLNEAAKATYLPNVGFSGKFSHGGHFRGGRSVE